MVDIDRRNLLRAAGAGAAGGLFFRGLPDRPTVAAGDLTSDVDDQRHELGTFAVVWESTEDGPRLGIDYGGDRRWQTFPGENFLEAVDGGLDAHKPQGPHVIKERRDVVRPDQHVASISATGGRVTIAGELTDSGSDAVAYKTTIEVTSEGHLQAVTTAPDGPDRLGLRYETPPDERYHGFGLQPRHLDLAGKEVRMVTEEPGISRDHVYMEFLVELDTPGASGTTVSTYAPSAYYLSNKGYSFVLENQEYSVFDLRRDREASIRCYSDDLTWRLIGGDDPLERVESYSDYCGRMPQLPAWIHDGPIVGMQGGTDEVQEREGVPNATARVRDVWEELQARDTPLAGFWLQDWCGIRITDFGEQLWWDWELDEDHYPNWDDLVAELNGAGVELLGYVNPYLVEIPDDADHEVDRYLYEEAKDEDYFVTKDGEIFGLTITSFDAAIVDLSNPDAFEWLRDVIASEMAKNGFRGWMADFGEGLPFDGEITNGSGMDYHNEYVVDWARLNREIRQLDEVTVDGESIDVDLDDAVFFTRSGFTQTPRHSTLTWTGDQYTSWDDRDGLETSIRGLLTSGISGITLSHFDSGGYTSIAGAITRLYRRPELLKRWNEVSAFTAVFRTHEGNEPQINAQIYSSDDLYDHFSRCAKIYAGFAPYRKELCRLAADRGRPVVRPLFLHYPNDQTLREMHTQFLLGPDVLVAPIVTKSARSREVYVPDDGWIHLWTGDVYGSGWHSVDAPIGEPPVFYQQAPEYDVLLQESIATLRDNGVLDQ
jgi:alpha-glucosidase (family GH31 glycosyl hydrolase)